MNSVFGIKKYIIYYRFQKNDKTSAFGHVGS